MEKYLLNWTEGPCLETRRICRETGSMEKRRSKRKQVLLEGNFICESVTYDFFIENVSENGLHLISASKNGIISFIPETTFELNLNSSLAGKTNLCCEIRWVHINKTPIHGFTYRMGSEILHQPSEYLEFLNNLR